MKIKDLIELLQEEEPEDDVALVIDCTVSGAGAMIVVEDSRWNPHEVAIRSTAVPAGGGKEEGVTHGQPSI
jgi:hypothetical protein